LHPGLAHWWRQVEERWEAGRVPTETLPLRERFDYHGQLTAQLPTAPQRVVYTKSGVNLVAARVQDASALVDHTCYWASAESEGEALYLAAILNSRTVRERTKPFQARGLFGERHFDKYIFYVPIPTYHAATKPIANLPSWPSIPRTSLPQSIYRRRAASNAYALSSRRH
jgi:hypothetical protein